MKRLRQSFVMLACLMVAAATQVTPAVDTVTTLSDSEPVVVQSVEEHALVSPTTSTTTSTTTTTTTAPPTTTTTTVPPPTTAPPTTVPPTAPPTTAPAPPPTEPPPTAPPEPTTASPVDCGPWWDLIHAYFGDAAPKACAVVGCETGYTWDPTIENPRSTASGLFQDLDSTWNGHGGYSRAMYAPVEMQVAFNYNLYLQRGWQPWVCA